MSLRNFGSDFKLELLSQNYGRLAIGGNSAIDAVTFPAELCRISYLNKF